MNEITNYLFVPFLVKILVYQNSSWLDLVALIVLVMLAVYSKMQDKQSSDLDKDLKDAEFRILSLESRLKEVEKITEDAKKLINQSVIANAFKTK